MTTAAERTRALVQAGDFLEALAAAQSPADIAEIRDRAQYILRHYPSNTEIALAARAASTGVGAIGPLLDPTAVPDALQKGYRRW